MFEKVIMAVVGEKLQKVQSFIGINFNGEVSAEYSECCAIRLLNNFLSAS